MDFITGLAIAKGKDVIMVVVDCLTKYTQFVGLSHPYSTTTVAQAFLDNIYHLHGLPQSIVNDRDFVFISTFWKHQFYYQGVEQKLCFGYHPKTDSQIEVVNRCLETYLRCMTSEEPTKWLVCLPLGEW